MLQQTKTIFITNFHLLVARNILGTDVLKTLAQDSKLRIIIFVPDYKENFIKNLYKGDNIIIEGINQEILKRTSFISRLVFRILFSLIPTYTIKLRFQERLRRKKTIISFLIYYFSRLVTKVFSRSKSIHHLLRKCDYYFSNHKNLHHYFDKYQPSLVFSTDIFSAIDPLFVQAAKAKKIRSIGMVRSWDNTTTKGLMIGVPDVLIVNNEIIKQEAIEFHDLKPKDIFVGGIPQFDLAIRGYHEEKKHFFEKIKVDPEKQLILFAPAGYILSNTDWQICEILKKGLADGKLPDNLHFLVRSHPGDPALLEKFESNDHFTIERPGSYFKISLKVTELTPADAKHLISSLYHSEMIIYVNSTIGIDSLVFNKPQIMIEFDGWEKKHYLDSVKHLHDEDHMQKYLKTGAVNIVKNEEELFAGINAYLKNPNLDQESRKKATQEQIYKLDGQSGKRIANFILDQLIS